jgi:phytanoyl-CoA hydroxylase
MSISGPVISKKSNIWVLYRIHNLEAKHPSVRQIAEAPVLRQAVASALGEQGMSSAFALTIKMPGGGGAVPWHRDPVDNRPGRIFNFSIYLDGSFEENGCLEVLEDSHLLPLDGGVGPFRPVGAQPVMARRGDVIIHDVRLIHGSAAIVSLKRRRSIVIEFRAGDLL